MTSFLFAVALTGLAAFLGCVMVGALTLMIKDLAWPDLS